jgi:hypothetical protein
MFDIIYYAFLISPVIFVAVLVLLKIRKKANKAITLICTLYPAAVIVLLLSAGIWYYSIPVAYSAGQPEPTTFIIDIDENTYEYADTDETFPEESALKPIARSGYPEHVFSSDWAKEILFAPRYTTLKNGSSTDIYYYCKDGKFKYSKLT